MDFSEVEDLGFEEFFTSVLNRTEVFERIVRSDDEEHRSSLHSHIDLLERTAILPVQLSQVVIYEADLQMLEGLIAVAAPGLGGGAFEGQHAFLGGGAR